MDLCSFIPILECALKCADNRVLEVSLTPGKLDEVRVFLDDHSYILIGVCDMSLLEVLGFVPLAVSEEEKKDDQV